MSKVQTFYTVDTHGTLVEGSEIDLVKYKNITPGFLQEHVDEVFEDGVSSHGNAYLLNSDMTGNHASPAIELLFEYVRRAQYPHITSRYQSLFACESVESAIEFRSKYRSGSENIFEVKTSNVFLKANMKMLENGQTALITSFLAHEYWKGKTQQNLETFWEVLLSLPVKIGRKI